MSCKEVKAPVEVPLCQNAKEQYTFAKKLHLSELPESQLLMYIKPEHREAKINKAIYAYSKVIEYFPKDTVYTPLASVDIANLYTMKKEYKTAVKIYNEALDKYSKNDFVYAASLYGLGKCYHRMEKYPKSIECFNKCIEEFDKKTTNKEIQTIVLACKQNLKRIK